MKKDDTRVFDCAVEKYFRPFIENFGLALRKVREDIYEVRSSSFTMRIRFCVGRRRSILATLMRTSEGPQDFNDTSMEIGLAVIADFFGTDMVTQPAQDEGEFLELAKETAIHAERFIIPYLSGERNNFEDLRRHVELLVKKFGVQEKRWHFPSKVQKRWQWNS